MPSALFRIRSLQVGAIVVYNVTAAIGPENGDRLLGQSFLRKFQSWRIDNDRHMLIVNIGDNLSVAVVPDLGAASPDQSLAEPAITAARMKAADKCRLRTTRSAAAARMIHIFCGNAGGHVPKELSQWYGTKADEETIMSFLLAQDKCTAVVYRGARSVGGARAMREALMLFATCMKTHGQTAELCASRRKGLCANSLLNDLGQ